jgi:hypothetical protein
MTNSDIIQQPKFKFLLTLLDPEAIPYDSAVCNIVSAHVQVLSQAADPMGDCYDFNAQIEHKILSNTQFFMASESGSYIGLFDFMGQKDFVIELDLDWTINVLGDTLSNWAEVRYPSPFYRPAVDNFVAECQKHYGIAPDQWDHNRYPDFFSGYVTV